MATFLNGASLRLLWNKSIKCLSEFLKWTSNCWKDYSFWFLFSQCFYPNAWTKRCLDFCNISSRLLNKETDANSVLIEIGKFSTNNTFNSLEIPNILCFQITINLKYLFDHLPICIKCGHEWPRSSSMSSTHIGQRHCTHGKAAWPWQSLTFAPCSRPI